MSSIQFPANFTWGAATAAYQVEGAASAYGKGESVWDRFSHQPGNIERDETGDVACDQYHRYPEDIKLMQELSLHAYRFSISWPRIYPQGAANQVAGTIVALLIVPTFAVVLERHTGLVYALEILAGLAALMVLSMRPEVRAALERLEALFDRPARTEMNHV